MECEFKAMELIKGGNAVVQRATNLLYYRPRKAEQLMLRLTEDFKSITIYTLEQDGAYSVPSLDYHSDQELLPTPRQIAKFGCAPENPAILLIDSSAFPVSVFVDSAGKPQEDLPGGSRISALTIGLIVGISWLCIFIVGAIVIWRCCRRRKKPTEVRIVPNEPTRLQMSLKPSPQLIEELDAKFPVERFASLKQPFCLSCLVCLETFTLSSEVRTLACQHTFHRHCLETLFSQRKRCCVCQRDYSIVISSSEASPLEVTSDVQHASGISQTGFFSND